MSQPAQRTRPRRSVRIAIVEDHTLFAESLDLALAMEQYDVRRVPVADLGTPRAVLTAVLRMRPDIVLLDLDLGDVGDGGRLVTPIARSGAAVVVVTASPDQARWGECLWYGARKVISKGRPLNEILATIRRLSQGLSVTNLQERDALLQAWQSDRREHEALRANLDRLTTRESQVLGMLMEGRTVSDIAAASVVSVATVRTQVKSILAKLEVSSQLAAVGLAHAVDWHPPRSA